MSRCILASEVQAMVDPHANSSSTAINVGSLGNRGPHLLAVSLTARDPLRTLDPLVPTTHTRRGPGPQIRGTAGRLRRDHPRMRHYPLNPDTCTCRNRAVCRLGLGLGRDLDQIETGFLGERQSVGNRNIASVVAILVDRRTSRARIS